MQWKLHSFSPPSGLPRWHPKLFIDSINTWRTDSKAVDYFSPLPPALHPVSSITPFSKENIIFKIASFSYLEIRNKSVIEFTPCFYS